MKYMFYYLACFCLSALVCFAAFSKSINAQTIDGILAHGTPPLTQSMVVKTIVLVEWSLEIRLSDEERSRITQAVVGYWKANNTAEINNTVEAVNTLDGLKRASPEDQRKVREILRADMLQGLRSDTEDEISQMVLRAYEAAHSANSKPTSASSNSNTSAKSRLRVGADGFTGVYRMLRPRALNINNSVSESGYWIEYITFLPGGNVYWTLPPEGLLYFDPAVSKKADPDDWGTYKIQTNGEIHILRGPTREPYVITRTGERLNNPPSLGKGSFRPVPSADGLKLDGNYRRDQSEPSITFTSDGHFRDEGVFRYFGDLARPDGTGYQDDGRGGSGTYIIEQNTLELRYSDGRVKLHPFIAFPENLSKKPALDSFILRREETMKRY